VGYLYVLVLIFLISIVSGLIFSILLMNLGIMEIPPKYYWMNIFLFNKGKNILETTATPSKRRVDYEKRLASIIAGELEFEPLPILQSPTSVIISTRTSVTTISGAISSRTTATTTTQPIVAVIGAKPLPSPVTIRPDYFDEEVNVSSANRESNKARATRISKPLDWQFECFSAGGYKNEANY